MPRRWSDVFTLVSQRKVGHCGGKTTPADELTWEGSFDGQPISIVSTVRLTCGNMAHFLTHSGARIGTFDWNLVGGHLWTSLSTLKGHSTLLSSSASVSSP